KCLIEEALHIVQDQRVDRAIVAIGGLQVWQLDGTLVGCRAPARAALPPRRALFKDRVAEHAAAKQGHLQRPLLRWCWMQPVVVSFANATAVLSHADIFRSSGRNQAILALLLPAVRLSGNKTHPLSDLDLTTGAITRFR